MDHARNPASSRQAAPAGTFAGAQEAVRGDAADSKERIAFRRVAEALAWLIQVEEAFTVFATDEPLQAVCRLPSV